MILAAGTLLGPLSIEVAFHQKILQTSRLNVERVAIASALFLRPGESYTYRFTAEEDGLSSVEVFMRPEAAFWSRGTYRMELSEVRGGQMSEKEFSGFALWDDVASMTFEPVDDSARNEFELRITNYLQNEGTVQLGHSVDRSGSLIFQPYYQTPTSFVEAMAIVWLDRLQWRWVPFALLFPAIILFLTHLVFPSLKSRP